MYEVKGNGFCQEYLYHRGCKTLNCHLVHIQEKFHYIDSHCHLELIQAKCGQRFQDFNYPKHYRGCIANFVFPPYYGSIEEFCKLEGVWLTLGMHPKYAHCLHEYKDFLMCRAAKLDIVGIGETGLDSKTGTSLTLQMEAFLFQINLAKSLNKTLVLHCRGFSTQVFEICQKNLHRLHKIHLHCFTGSIYEMHQWCAAFPNLMIGVTNLVNNDCAHEVYTLVKELPLERLVLETDGPHFVPKSNSAQMPSYSHPGLALNVAVRVSEIKSVSVRKVLKAAMENTTFLFSLKC